MSDELYEKYTIIKRDGTSIAPEASYFVLRLDTDQCAREAAGRYADCVEAEWPGLAHDLRDLLATLEERHDQAD